MLNILQIDLWTVFIYFVNDDNLFRIVAIEMVLPTNQFILRLSVPGCDFTPPVGFLDQTEVICISCNPGSSRTGSISTFDLILVPGFSVTAPWAFILVFRWK